MWYLIFQFCLDLVKRNIFKFPRTSVTFLALSLDRKVLDCDEEKEPDLNLSLLALSD